MAEQPAKKRGFTQRVTANDIATGQIRFPVTDETKSFLPRDPADVDVVLKGVPIGEQRYDARMGPDRERSGVLRVPAEILRELVREDERLGVHRDRRGVLYIGDRGSKLRIAQWVNEPTGLLNSHLLRNAPTLADFTGDRPLDWRSPLHEGDYAELADDLWNRLELPPPDPVADGFWPAGGPNWDAVANVVGPHDVRGLVLVEAKSHIAEVKSKCGATAASSMKTIANALESTQRYLGAPATNWLEPHYQVANRLAFLYYLRARRNIPAWVFFVYFLGDNLEVEGVARRCPTTEEEWEPTIVEMKRMLALPTCHPLSGFAVDAFIPAVPEPREAVG